MAGSSPALAEALADIVGREHLVDEAPALDAHAVDGVRPRWVARPGGVEEVGRVLTLAHTEGLAVAPRGSGADLALGNPPRRLDLVVDLARLNAVTDYVPEDMVATVEAGASLAALGRRLAERGQMLALDPIGGSTRSIGGVLASNAAGPLRFRYGTARDLTLGVRFVQADGTITWGGAKVVKSVTGYDVPKLLVGSLGTLGVVVGATLRLHPLPLATGSWLFAWSSRAAAEGFLAALLGSSLEPERVTLLNREASRADGELALLVSIASVEEAVGSQGAALTRLAAGHGGHVQAVPASCWGQLGEALRGAVALRLNCEPKRLIFWLGELERVASRLGLRAAVVAQAGNGVLQCALQGEVSGAALDGTLLRPLRDGLAPEGGSLVVERAPAALKAELDVWGPIHPDVLAIMSRVKREFDPDGILNPGRFVGGL
ncbi:MAG: FAD-linked oxidase [Candidatus Rokuibacteriota bacterium]|nr:MAG: FAD-linked oxidase [Candidatus Rokubacteria bacterium]